MNKTQAVDFLAREPYKYGRLIGFENLSELHNEWIVEMLRGKDDITIQAHRGSYKTTCASIALALTIILLPNKRTMFMRKTDGDTREVMKQVQKILLDPHTQYFVQTIYGINLKMQTQSVAEISTNLTTDIKGTAQLVGIGIGGSITGKHFDRIFTDDIVNVSDRVSKAERERTKIVYQELQNVRNKGGRIVNTGTPWHKEDCFSIMPAPRKYDCYTTGLLSKEELDGLRQSMLPSLFAANYELKHIPSEDVIFTTPNTGADPSLVEQGICHIDAAYYGEDFTAFTIVNRIDGKYYVYGRIWRRHVDDVSDEIIRLRKAFNGGKIYCEDNGDKGYLAKALRNKGELVGTYHESMNKYLKITTYLKDQWTNVVFVKGTDEAYINQICDYNENAEHDDAPDSLASLMRRFYQRNADAYRSPFGG